MDQNPDGPVRHRVVLPLDGLTVADAKEEVMKLGLDPEAPEARLLTAFQAEPRWEAVVTFEVGAAGAVATGFEIRSTRGEAITRSVWDRVRIAALVREAAAQVEWLAPITGAESVRVQRSGGTGRPPEYTDDFYRAVGRVYSAAVAAGKSPVRAVARAFEGQPHPTTNRPFSGLSGPADKRARTWVRAARARGYIADGSRRDGG